MKKHCLRILLVGFVACMMQWTVAAKAEKLSKDLVEKATEVLKTTVPDHMQIGKPRVTSIDADAAKRLLTVDLNTAYADVPFTAEGIESLKQSMKGVAGAEYADYEVAITINGKDVNNYLPAYEKRYARKHARIVDVQDANRHYTKGLDGNIVALWQSHGWYFEPKLDRWEWQRARIWQTVEDLYTQSYVMPFLMPMLENAGAYVMSPRERDVHDTEVIVDNDGGKAQTSIKESNSGKKWKTGSGAGFAWKRDQYVGYENPFVEGTYRQIETAKKGDKVATVRWSADMPEDGSYAVYVSYKTLAESVDDAEYTINSAAGSRTIKVNQRMGGGTWIYLGHYPLKKGANKDVVVLTNKSDAKGIVTADAVKIGGGMGNVARRVEKPQEGDEPKYDYDANIDYQYQLSKHPRFTEGARYWLQWAGAPDTVYSQSKLINDYTDDYKSRGEWVNWLAGGSEVLKDRAGLNVSVDIALGFHSDAGETPDDGIIGTLGIYMTNGFGDYANGTPRNYSRLLTNAISTNIVNDIRAEYEPNWTRRGMWDKSYFEARVPEVPTMLLELLSHHNFADMKYGLDPAFRFTVSRSIYKGMLEFIAKRDGRDYVVQPLPVNSFAITPASESQFLLTWKPTQDQQSDNADATRYVVEERVGGGAFREVAVVNEPRHLVNVNDNEVHSYRIVAMNDGGRSFESETLALGVAKNAKGTVMVVNGFTRVSAPDWFDAGTGDGELAGFNDAKDHGVPYLQDISYIGSQFEFRRRIPWTDDDSSGFGASNGDYETKVVAGNTFDYASVHGEAVMAAGYNFVSASVKAVEDGLALNDYFAVDFVFGKQKETQLGRGAVANRYKIFTQPLMDAIANYTAQGGNVMASGSYVASDIWDKRNASNAEKTFARDVLGYRWRMSQAEASGKFYIVPTAEKAFDGSVTGQFNSTLSADMYCVESPDGILPSSKKGITVMKYADNNMSAAVASRMGGYQTVVMGFPFETIAGKENRQKIMGGVLNFFENR